MTAFSIQGTSSVLKKKEKPIKPFGFKMEPTIEESKISLTNIHGTIIPKTLPWIIKKPKMILELDKLPKTKTHLSTYEEKVHNIMEYPPNHFFIFTDGSKENDEMYAAISNKKSHLYS